MLTRVRNVPTAEAERRLYAWLVEDMKQAGELACLIMASTAAVKTFECIAPSAFSSATDSEPVHESFNSPYESSRQQSAGFPLLPCDGIARCYREVPCRFPDPRWIRFPEDK